METYRTQIFTAILVFLVVSTAGHKRNSPRHEKRRDVRQEVTCPPPLGMIRVHGQSENIPALMNQGGLSNLVFMCGTTQVPYQAPTRWVMREGPNGSMMNVTIYEKRYKMVPLCCPGYTRNDQDVCVPKCKGNCTNGLCIRPDECVCYDGYALNRLGDCVVTCPCGCPNGQCFGNTCVCGDGYQLDSNGVCNPVCINECEHGDCSAPNHCSCHVGYKKVRHQDSHVCSPHCNLECENGKCVAPDVCKCKDGYERERNTGRCIPKCYSCENGDCVAPYTCHCHKGYRRENEACAPVCAGGCYNATCSAPDECTCFKGFKHTTPHTCVPKCTPACQNALCVSPNTCECYPGYMKKNLSSYKCESIVSSAVNGVSNVINAMKHR